MIDCYGRTIDYMRISVTDRCNLRCIYCVPEGGIHRIPAEKLLTDEEIIRIAEAAAKAGVRHIKVTGGEPLLREQITGLIQKLRQITGIETVTLTTNGMMLPEKIHALAEAGIDGVNISLDTLDAGRYREMTRGGNLQEALDGLKAAVRVGVPVKVNAVLYEEHWQEDAFALSKLAKKYPVHVRFIEHMPLGTEVKEKAVLEEDILAFLEKYYGESTVYKEKIGEGPGHYFSFSGLQGKIGFISAMSHKFCSGCNRIRLTADGDLRMCLQSKEVVGLRERLRSGISEEELVELFQKSVAKKPAGHHMEERKIEAEGMCQIGG